MFGIGLQEMLIILVVVLIVFGPKRLPDLAKSLGKGIAEFKKASDEVRKGIEEAVQEEEEKNLSTAPGEADRIVEARPLEAHSGDPAPSDAPPADAPPADAQAGGSEPAAPQRRD